MKIQILSFAAALVVTTAVGCTHETRAAYKQAEAERAAEVKNSEVKSKQIEADTAQKQADMKLESDMIAVKTDAVSRLDDISGRLDRFQNQIAAIPGLSSDLVSEYTQAAEQLKADVAKCKQGLDSKMSSAAAGTFDAVKNDIDEEIDALDERADRLLHQI